VLAPALLVLASVTDKLTELATNVVGDLGLAGVFVLMLLESACVPIPSEATMLFAGFNVSRHHYSLFEAVAVGSVANLVGSWVAYAIGYYGRIELVERHAVFHVKASQLATAERWFEKWGAWTVFFSRLLPVVRTFISLPAGVARMPLGRFSLLTLAGCIPWVLFLTVVGQQVGDRWRDWKHSLQYVDYTVAALIVVGALVLLVRWRRSRARAAADVAA
jgi:membrane protein DedA with SNARE-associated domain